MKLIYAWDSYNNPFDVLPDNSGVIGTVRQVFMAKATKNGWKILEYEEIQASEHRQRTNQGDHSD